ncbi:MAG: cytochrome c3 family protein [Nitrospirota bacterium]|jgi:predicted CXXCH cytochrome family protein
MGTRVFLLLTFLALMLLPAGQGRAEEMDCLMCHGDLAEGKAVHAAVQMGCTVCHIGVDASDIPHKFTGEKGLSAAPPDLCFQCHSKDEFSRKVLHAPVAGGMCLFCHTPHSGPNESLLTTEGNGLCLQCHNGIDKKPHAISRFTSLGHKLSAKADPLREGKPFSCLSCHMPHSSDWVKLFRYEARDASGICKHCHEFLQ